MPRMSNDTGRAFEYCVVKEIVDSLALENIPANFTERANRDNIRDERYYNSLSEVLRKKFSDASKAFFSWMVNKHWFSEAENVVIDRLPDQAGVQGDVTDVLLQIQKRENSEEKRISLKHRHDALKHPRLPSLPEQCGIDDVKICSDHRELHKKIWEEFAEYAKNLNLKADSFFELKKIDKFFIENNLYQPLNEMVLTFLKKHTKNKEHLVSFFKFIISNQDFYTIKLDGRKLMIKHFLDINLPENVKITYPYAGRKTTFLAEFNNGWKITFRLHTASTKFISNGKILMNTKYDVISINLEEVIKIETIDL